MNRLATIRERYRVTVDPLRTERRIELVALGLALLLCLQLVYSGVRLAFFATPGAMPPAADALGLDGPPLARQVDRAQSEEVRARPLFWQSRRPSDDTEDEAETEAASEKVAAAELKDFKLQGVFGSGDTAGIIALVKKKKQRILLGEEVAGWQLESVSPDHVVLVSDGKRTELRLKSAVIKAVEQEKKPSGKKAPAEARRTDAKKATGTTATQPPPTPADQRVIRRRG
jgi:hypothetical protein